MKKSVIILICLAIFLPFICNGQTDPERGIITYSGRTTINDRGFTPYGDTVIKIGTMAENIFEGEVYFGWGNFQAGLFASYGQKTSLSGQYFALEKESYAGGLMLRQNADNIECKFGLGYYNQKERHYGLENGYPFDYQVNSSGLIIPARLKISHEGSFVPKIEGWFSQKLAFTPQFSEYYLRDMGTSFGGEMSLWRFVILPEIYISPIVGADVFEIQAGNNPLYKAGMVISSNNYIRSDIVKMGYFRDLHNKFGTEGLFITVNPIGIYYALKRY